MRPTSNFRLLVSTAAVFLSSFLFVENASAARYPVPRIFRGTNLPVARNGFSPVIIATGAERDYIKSLHILDRPYRPLHFYGNTVRRRHFRQCRR